jgi:hypothetical protein
MRKILMLAALAEGVTGVCLLALPQTVIRLLFASDISGSAVMIIRIAGIGLIGLAVFCWAGKHTSGAFRVMLTYSTLALLGLTFIGVRGERAGVLLWAAVVAHAIIGVLLLRARFNGQVTAAR